MNNFFQTWNHLRLPDTWDVNLPMLFLLLTGLGMGVFLVMFILTIPRLWRHFLQKVFPSQVQDMYEKIIKPSLGWVQISIILVVVDSGLLILRYLHFFDPRSDHPLGQLLGLGEFTLGLGISINICLLGFRLFKDIFDGYLIDIAIRSKGKANSEILVLYKFLANATIVLLIVFIFAQTHRINLVGLLASLGVGGIAVALASQKVLEQVLWSILLYFDRPFTVDDYIHLPDRTFGRVESIGWRSTKIRLSGKGTLVIIPNSMLTQMAIENLSGAQKLISLITIVFYRTIPDQEQALVKQIILSGTKDIYGIDHRLTEVIFQPCLPHEPTHNGKGQGVIQAKITFFILGSNEVSMDLRSQFLQVARQNIVKQLRGYGIAFDLEENAVDILSPMNI